MSLWRNALYRAVRLAAPHAGLHAYEPSREHEANLASFTTFADDARSIRDKRSSTRFSDEIPDLTLTAEGLADVLAGRDWTDRRVLEVGPKYGVHSLWIDEQLRPSQLVFCDFEADSHRHELWVGSLQSPHRFVYGDLRSADELLSEAPFDLVFFLGVLYHSAHHVELLARLNRLTRLGGSMLLETTVDPRPDASVRLRWQEESAKAKAVPTLTATRLLLAWTGWCSVTRFTDYRPGSSEVLLLCEKTHELSSDGRFAELVRPQRPS
ncbi:MAG: class I SAM-dependent methyltransferase [Gaiella sp.]